MNHRLHVGNLSATTTAATLSAAFQQDGRTVVRVQLVMSREPGLSRGFGFVDMGNADEAAAAIQALDGTDVDGRTVRVSTANQPKSRFGGAVGGLPTSPRVAAPETAAPATAAPVTAV